MPELPEVETVKETLKKLVLNKKSFLFGLLTGISLFLIFSTNIFAFKSIILSPNLKIGQIFSILDKYYVDDYDKEAAQDSMYYGLVDSLGDPYTSYMDKETFSSFMEQTEGAYVGIGTVVSIDKNDDSLIIVAPYENSPASKAGILPGDKILSVGDIAASKNNYEEIIHKLKGNEGTAIKIKIFRPSENKNLEFDVIREKINIPTVAHKILDNNIGYIRISNFDKNTYEQFKNAYAEISKSNLKSLIIDLRNNPGGLLDTVVKIADELVPKGCIVYTEDKAGNKNYSYSDDNYIKLPLAIIVNQNSASASEVLSGAVKDLKRGVLVGEKTFGKGLVQNLFSLRDGSAVKVTIAKYYTPSGVCINGKGIEPDYQVSLPNELSVKIPILKPEQDTQLQKAIEVLSQTNK